MSRFVVVLSNMVGSEFSVVSSVGRVNWYMSAVFVLNTRKLHRYMCLPTPSGPLLQP